MKNWPGRKKKGRCKMGITEFTGATPDVLFIIAVIGALCVIGATDYLRCFFETTKRATRWVVLAMSLFVAVNISPLVPVLATTVVIGWLLTLALATLFKKHIIDAVGKVIDALAGKISGANAADNKGGK
jgi:hypothetical protein